MTNPNQFTDNRNLHNSELLTKLDDFIRKYYKNRLLRGAIFFTGAVLSFFLLVSLLEYFGRFDTGFRTFLFYDFWSRVAGVDFLHFSPLARKRKAFSPGSKPS